MLCKSVGAALVGIAAAAYWLPGADSLRIYNHFVWQALAFLHGTARDGTPYSMLVAIIIRVGPDGLNTHVDEYFDRVLDPLHKQEPSRR